MSARLVLVVCMLLAGSALAQPSKDDRAKAASHFKQGQLYFQQGDWDRAIGEYQLAFDLSHEPLLVFNIALCLDKAQRPEEALAEFQKYLDMTPSGQVADEAREDVVRLTPVVDAIKAKRAAEQAERDKAAAEQAQRAEEAKRKAAADAAEAQRRAEQARQAERAREAAEAEHLERRARFERWGGIAAAGLGGVAIGVGIVYGLEARADGQAITDHTSGAWTDALLAKDAEGHAAETKMVVFTITGGALVVGGAVLYAIGHHTASEAERLRVGVVPTAHGTTLAISGRF